jgi:hypothetical protein
LMKIARDLKIERQYLMRFVPENHTESDITKLDFQNQ